ncbi:hypothetical protein L1785_05450 [Antribacter sp. KLBMP9083]|uniref:Uncharacterized protein n=1 Tax=Antribacter soli TaxID=2910976 RepID=A0AA41UAS4_9MICO|nr:hypothetical protein [Antribacter soli]MCF4120419.1 hypothetical protein [Antribacter soli]
METAKFYTKARRIPMLVGKMPSGARIWGGPYTLTQIGAGALVAFALWKTASLWARFGGFMNLLVAVGLVVGAVWATGKIPNTGRNPVGWIMDAFNLTSTPGRLSGRQLTLPKPRLVTHRVAFAARVPARVPDAGRAPSAVASPWPSVVPAGPVLHADPVPPALPPLTPGDVPSSVGGPSPEAPESEARRREARLTGVGQLLAGSLVKGPGTGPDLPPDLRPDPRHEGDN